MKPPHKVRHLFNRLLCGAPVRGCSNGYKKNPLRIGLIQRFKNTHDYLPV
jgi:hypothetical protein